MPPKVYGTEHILFLVIFFVLAIVATILIKKYAKTTKAQDIVVKIVAGLLFIAVMWNRISIAVLSNNYAKLIPNSFCGMSSLVFALAVLIGKRNNNVLHFVVYLAFAGGLGVIIYPTFLGDYDTFWHTITFSGMLHHTLSFYLSILVQIVYWFKPNYRKWPNLVIGFMAYITIGTFLITVLDVNTAFYINEPILSGTPLTVWVLMPIFAVGYAIYMLFVELIRKRKKEEKDSFEIIMKTLKKSV